MHTGGLWEAYRDAPQPWFRERSGTRPGTLSCCFLVLSRNGEAGRVRESLRQDDLPQECSSRDPPSDPIGGRRGQVPAEHVSRIPSGRWLEQNYLNFFIRDSSVLGTFRHNENISR